MDVSHPEWLKQIGMNRLSSTANPRIKRLRQLRNARHRQQTGLTVVEGFAPLTILHARRYPIKTLYIAPDILQQSPRQLELLAGLAPQSEEIVALTDGLFRKISYRENPEGILALIQPQITPLAIPPKPAPAFFLVLEDVEKPGNIGAVLRTADAAGCTGVIITNPRTDLFNPNIIRASMGAVFTVPIRLMSNQETLNWCRQTDIRLAVFTPEAQVPYDEYTPAQRTAFLFGTEHEGVSPFWRSHGDDFLTIPMQGEVNSLNLSNCAAIVAYHFRRFYQAPDISSR